MSATRRHFGRPARRKMAAAVSGVNSGPSIVMAETAVVSSAEKPVDPVCADPAVVLWDEVTAPDPAPSEDAVTGQQASPAPDRALH